MRNHSPFALMSACVINNPPLFFFRPSRRARPDRDAFEKITAVSPRLRQATMVPTAEPSANRERKGVHWVAQE